MAQSLESALTDLPVLRTMLGLEQFDQGQALARQRGVLQAVEAAGRLAELQGLPDTNRLRRAQADKVEFEAQRGRDLLGLQQRFAEILRRGDPAEIEAAIAQFGPEQYVSGQFRDKSSGLPDPVKLQNYVETFEDLYSKTGDEKYKRRADQLSGILNQRATSARDAKIQSYMDTIPGISRQDAIALADGQKRLAFNPVTGGVSLLDNIQAMQGTQGVGQGAGQAPPGAPLTSPPPSPYTAPPPAPGVRDVVPGTKHTERLDREVQELSTRLGQKNINRLDATAGQVEEMFRKYEPGAIPGVGFIQSSQYMNPVYGAGSAMTEGDRQKYFQEAQVNRRNLKAWSNDILRMSAGLAQTVQETANVLNETLNKGTATEIDIRNAYNQWRLAYEQDRAGLFSGSAPEVVAEFYRRKGEAPKFWSAGPESAETLGQDLIRRGIRGFEVQDASSFDFSGLRRPPKKDPEKGAPRRRLRFDSQGREIR